MSDIVQQLRDVMAQGDEAAARKFILDHFDELPAELQKELATEMFAESLQGTLAKQKEFELKTRIAGVIDELEKGA